MMLPPWPALYISCSAARVVRNAPSRWIARSCFHFANSASCPFSVLAKVVVNDFAETKRQVGDDVGGGEDFEHRQFRDGSERVGMQIERARSGPSALQIDVLKAVFDQFADPRAAVDMRYDLQKEIWRLERRFDRGVIGRLVLVTHGPGRHPHGTVIERA